MGIFDDLLVNRRNLHGEQLAQQVIARLATHTSVDIVSFDILKKECDLFDCKIGGPFFLLNGDTLLQQHPSLFLLAQINFARIANIEGFPKKGILQLFMDGQDGMYGLDLVGYKAICRYYPDTITNYQVVNPDYSQAILPFDYANQYQLIGKLASQHITMCDYRFDSMINKHCHDILEPSEIYFDDEFMDYLYENEEVFPCQISGYPSFAQNDIRSKKDDRDILLFQLNSVQGICFGDMGVCNFFISESDLVRQNFNNVWYNWDCS